MSLYSNYIKEREGKEVLETPYGFASYIIAGKECYLADIYVLPTHRKTKLAYSLAQQVCSLAKEQGCTHLTGSVDSTVNNADNSLRLLLQYGMRLLKVHHNVIYFVKEL